MYTQSSGEQYVLDECIKYKIYVYIYIYIYVDLCIYVAGISQYNTHNNSILNMNGLSGAVVVAHRFVYSHRLCAFNQGFKNHGISWLREAAKKNCAASPIRLEPLNIVSYYLKWVHSSHSKYTSKSITITINHAYVYNKKCLILTHTYLLNKKSALQLKKCSIFQHSELRTPLK